MRPAHIDALLPYERDMFGAESWSARSYRDELADARHRYYLAVERAAERGAEDAAAGDLLGWAGVLIVGDAAEILTVGVIPAARRRGIARLLLAELLAEARRRGAREAFLEVRVDNPAARELYRTDGFADLGVRRGYYEGGRVDAITMRRAL